MKLILLNNSLLQKIVSDNFVIPIIIHHLLLEDGSDLLLEDGSFILMEN
jgi:hypothetical protein